MLTPVMKKAAEMTKKCQFIKDFLLGWHFDRSGDVNLGNNIRRALLITRYLLFILTSVFYLAGPPYSPIVVKIAVVLTILFANILAQNLYNSCDTNLLYKIAPASKDVSDPTYNYDEVNSQLLLLIIGETIGSALLILPTGGLESPFVWYALNPIIAAVVYLPVLYCWGMVVLFLGTAIGVSMVYEGYTGYLVPFISRHMSILLVFFLSTSLAQVAVSLYKRLGLAYTCLAMAHSATERSLEHISSLYQALEAFSTREDPAQLADVLAFFAGKLCGEPAACFLRESIEDEGSAGRESILRITNNDGGGQPVDWDQEIYRLWSNVNLAGGIVLEPVKQETGQLIAVPVTAHGECFGLLACLQSVATTTANNEKERSLTFLARVAGIILERLKTDKLWARLLVSEEQNRIANEIHDGIAQYLFSMVCALDNISKEQTDLQEERIQEQLKLLMDTANRASRELRASIYELSPHHRGESIFVDNLASYLDNLGRLNHIQVDLQAEGSEEVLSSALRKGLYRIVREASSNSIRHGKCSALKVSLTMLPNRTVLEIQDNGCGYGDADADLPDSWKTGLGKWNMRHLAQCFNGELEIHSEPGLGTTVRFVTPRQNCPGDRIKEAIRA